MSDNTTNPFEDSSNHFGKSSDTRRNTKMNGNTNGGPLPKGKVIVVQDTELSFTATPDGESPIEKFSVAPSGKIYFVSMDRRRYNWEPQPDITAYESALLMPIFFLLVNGAYGVDATIADLPENVRRHLEEVAS